MKMSELKAVIAAGQQRMALHNAGAAPPLLNLKHYGFFELGMFECPPFLMFSSNDVPVLQHVLDHGTFEPFSMAMWCRLAASATGIVDIGANVGIYSLAAAKLRPDLCIHAFEPNPYAFARLRVHKHLNNLPNLIEHPVGVNNKTTTTQLTWVVKPHGNISSGAGIGRPEITDMEMALVRVEALDGSGLASTLGPRPLVKIDVEGAEVVVLAGMKEILTLGPDIIIETFHEDACAAINDALFRQGYAVYQILEKERRLVQKPKLTPANPESGTHDFNQLLTKRPAAEIQALAGRG
jgi:FkbM family methyltransferase